jgi:DNA-binding transcriptional MocR family regulator
MMTSATSAKLARTAAAQSLAVDLGDWSQGTGALYHQLARAVAHAIDRGALVPGARLPSERELARAMSVSRGTAVAAYDRLVADDRVERRPGSGTYVVGELAELPEGREGSALVHRLVDASAEAADADHDHRDLIDLSLSVLPDGSAMGDLTIDALDLERLDPPSGYSPWGLAGLREAIADHVAGWGLPTTPDQIVVTTGAQQAISVAATCWIRPGDVVVVDDPTYPGAVAAFQQAGARLVGVPLDADGPDPAALEAAVAQRPALVYLQPVVQSPTGLTSSSARRRALAAVLGEARVPLVEDRSLADLAWGTPPAPLAAALADVPTILVGSLGKRFWGGLRLGFLRAPVPLALRCARIKATHDLGTSAISQVVGERLLRTATEPARLELVARLRDRYDALAATLHDAAPAWTWPEPTGGLSVWVDLAGLDGDVLAREALAAGLVVAAPGPLVTGGPSRSNVRLSFADALAPAVLRRVRDLAARVAGSDQLAGRTDEAAADEIPVGHLPARHSHQSS